MTTPPSSANAGLPDAANGVAQPTGRAKRRGPRRATAPAGSPTAPIQAAAPVLVVDPDGALITSPGSDNPKSSLPSMSPSASDAGLSPAAVDAPASKDPETVNPVAFGAGHAGSKDESSVAKTPLGDGHPSRNVLGSTPATGVPARPTDPSSETTQENKKPMAGSGAGTGDAPIIGASPTVHEGAETTVIDSASRSRRERRQTEQKSSSGVELSKPAPELATAAAAPATPMDQVAEDFDVKQHPLQQRPMRKRSRAASFIRGLLTFLLISILVAALGTGLVGKDDSAEGPGDTELHRQAAWERTTALAADATRLGEVAGAPKLAEALRATAQNLNTQAAALDDGLPVSTAEATASSSEVATGTPVPTLVSLLDGLTGNGEVLMQNALTAERAMGRVFAAVGTSQLLQGQQLSALAGSTSPKSSLLSERPDFAKPQGPQCSSTLEPRSGVTVDLALRAAALGEQKAIYAYQVAATRLDEPQFATAIELLAGHQEKLDLLNAELTVRCLQEALPVVGYALDSAFTETPLTALAGLESELSVIYADLVALSRPAPEFDVKSIRLPTSGPPAPSGTPTTSEETSPAVSATRPANNGLLREMSVAWLLDSSTAQIYWGGSVSPLAGMNP